MESSTRTAADSERPKNPAAEAVLPEVAGLPGAAVPAAAVPAAAVPAAAVPAAAGAAGGRRGVTGGITGAVATAVIAAPPVTGDGLDGKTKVPCLQRCQFIMIYFSSKCFDNARSY